jgi:hypothetical protein
MMTTHGDLVDAITLSICAVLALRSVRMEGIATFTMKMSTTYMNCAATTTVRTSQRRGLIALRGIFSMTRLHCSTGISPEFALWRNLIPPTQRQALHNPQKRAAQLEEFIDAGCSGFCLSGYPHHVEAERFGRLVMPLLVK